MRVNPCVPPEPPVERDLVRGVYDNVEDYKDRCTRLDWLLRVLVRRGRVNLDQMIAIVDDTKTKIATGPDYERMARDLDRRLRREGRGRASLGLPVLTACV